MDFCCCLVGWMCLGGLFEICPPVIVMELTLHSSRQRSGQVTPCAVWVQSQDMISVCAGVWGYFYPLWQEGFGCWALLGAGQDPCLQPGVWQPWMEPVWHWLHTIPPDKSKDIYIFYLFIFFFSIPVFPFSPPDASLKFLFHFQVLAGGTELCFFSPPARQVLKNMCC